MGTAESTQSPELGGIGGFSGHSSFRRQSPNVARLVRGENSQKMEYEFPISDVNSNTSGHYRQPHYQTSGTRNNKKSKTKTPQLSHQPINYNDNLLSTIKVSTNETTSLWSSFTNCFGCRTRDTNPSTTNSLRDKVHAIRIVRASNDLTPAVFDSHYNIITLEQLRECENNASGNLADLADAANLDNVQASYNGNGSASTTKNSTNRRMKKKKKKRTDTSAYTAKATASDEEDGYEQT